MKNVITFESNLNNFKKKTFSFSNHENITLFECLVKYIEFNNNLLKIHNNVIMKNDIPIKYILYKWGKFKAIDQNDYIHEYTSIIFHVYPLK